MRGTSGTLDNIVNGIRNQGMQQTLGPSLMRIDGIPRRAIAVVFHQFGAPRSDIFSLIESLRTRAGISAWRKALSSAMVGLRETTHVPGPESKLKYAH
jgi:hypothetical protein